ncbi:MAG: TonB-dependent receptor [Bacteroidaceae bacterium]|nr:TonB-dependent receptor [Bacteroidaceae bacterium]
MRINVVFLMLCFGTLGQLCAQSFKGRVLDKENNPIAGVFCVLIGQSDSAYIVGATTNSDGYFELKVNEDRECILQMSFIGFEKISIVCRPGNLGDFILNENAGLLEEVVVKGDSRHKDAIKETFFLTDSLRNSSKNSFQLLDKLPGISVDWASDAVKIGEYRDVPIMLNGREVGKELVQNLNPQRIKKIELLRFPKGKYGDMPIVLNYITYDNYLGYDLGVQSKGLVSFRTPNSHSENIGANFIYTLDKWNIYSDFNVSNKKMYSATSYSYLYKNEVAEATAMEDFRHPNNNNTNKSFNVSLGADYKIATKHTISIQSWLDGGKYDSFESYQTPENMLLSENSNNYRNINSTSGLFYRGDITDRFIITSDLTYNYYNVNENRAYENVDKLTQLDYSGRKDYWRYNANAYNIWNNILTSNVGYTYTDKSYINKDTNTDKELFRSLEKRHDIYASLMINPHQKVSLAIGGNVLFVHRDNGIDSDNRYSWMPSAKLHWQALKKLSVTGNYFCNIEYPNLDQLSTVTYNKNKILMYRGNPDLKERVMHYMEWRINVPKIIEFTYMLKHSANDITPWYFMENDYVVETLVGSKYLHQYIGLSGDYNIGQKFQVNFTANYQWYGRQGSDNIWHRGRTWYLDAMATYQMTSHLYLMAAYFLRHDKHPLLQGEEYGQEETLMLGLMSPLCKGKLSLSVNFAIPTSLVSKRTYYDITVPDFKFTSWEDQKVNNALVQVSLRYNFSIGHASRLNNENRSESEK